MVCVCVYFSQHACLRMGHGWNQCRPRRHAILNAIVDEDAPTVVTRQPREPCPAAPPAARQLHAGRWFEPEPEYLPWILSHSSRVQGFLCVCQGFARHIRQAIAGIAVATLADEASTRIDGGNSQHCL